MKKYLVILLAVILFAVAAQAENKAPSDYGKVVINGSSQKEGLAPVVFDHWLHRAKYTCRLCHVDIGFALKAGGTEIKAADNMKGLYCGVCHNGKMQHGSRQIFQACSTDKSDKARCERCHSQGKTVKKDYDFADFVGKLPKDRFGNGVNWEKAIEDKLIQPVDYLDGVSLKKPAQTVQQDFSISPKSPGMGEIIFSHRKHSQWNGCEVCHPEIFKGGKRGTTLYSMKENNEGKFCGVCHTTVSFPLADCDRCHRKPVK
jgi:c(7)-type cytochrome triheme protein